MLLEFAGQSASDPDNGWANTSRLLNCYREFAGDGVTVVKPVLGVALFGDGLPGPARATARVNGQLYHVQNGTLYRYSESGSRMVLGSVVDSPVTSISGNNSYVAIAAGGVYYVFDIEDETLTEIEPGPLESVIDVVFFGQRTVLLNSGRKVAWSALADPTSLDGLDFATTEARDERNLRALPIAGVLWIFKETSIEQWQNTPTGPQAIVGGAMEPGLKARNLLTQTPNGAFFIGSDNKAYYVRGGAMQPVSTVGVETSIQTEGPEDCVYYQDEGHEMCVITFPSRPAWCFDISTGEWHERPDFRVRTAASAYGKFFVSRDDFGIYELARNGLDFVGGLVCTVVGRTVANGANWFTVARMHVECQVGVVSRGEDTSVERQTAALLLNVSKDQGNSYGQTKTRSLGFIGDHNTEVVWRSLGRMKQFTPKLSWSDPITISAKATVDMV